MPLQLEELIETFNQNKNLFSPNRLSLEKIERIRSVFTSAFPIERISQLQLDEYVVGKPDLKTGVVNKSTFCYRLEHELDKLSGFGVKSALDFGIYYNQKKQKYLYKNEEKYHSAQEAFNAAKFEIFSILQAGKQYHIDHNFDNLLEKLEHDYIIRKNVISKLLSVYYPEAFIRIHSLGQIETVLQSFGKSTDNLDGRLFLAQSQLLEIKKAHPIMRQWNNGDFSHFVWKGIIERKSAISIKSDTGYNIIRNRSQVNDVGETEQQELRPDLHQLQGLKVFDDEELPELTAEDVKKGYQTVSEELLISEEKVTEVITALASGRHVLLAGPIGTGKTRLAQMVSEIFWEKVGGYLAEVHTATADWSTQDVIGGIMPKMENGKVVYEIQNGCAVDTVQKNWQNGIHGGRRIQSKSSAKDTPYRGIWLVIDEFNRADIDKAFGQLFTALRTHCLKIPTDEIDYSYRNLKIPEDYRIIGTLNTADKHFLFVLSDALKSRFAYIEMDIPSKQEYDKEIYYAMKNAISELGLNSNALVSLDSQSKKIVRGTLNQEFYERAYQAYYFLDSIRLFKKLGTAILQLIYQNMLVATRITGNPKMALDNSLTSTLLPQLEGLPQSEIGCIAALHSDSLVQFFRSAYKNPNRQSYAKAFIKALQYLQVPNGARLHSEFINGSLNAEDNNTWIPIQKAYDVTKNNFELNLNRVKYAIDDLKESAVF